MQWFQLIASLLPIAEAVYKAITDALAAGQAPGDIHQTIVDHAAALPAKVRAV